ncbi:hypothetical protein [Lactobacillus sp. LL6]|uniref:hypothetical protein n=1 Tax=Lactobacillus sp. LL6 TaxID=2596827 RepID=UPI001184968F|nr:hypothetical protein [Lactobacillus sp. LL6]TSO26885.1 hypothetical protein FOD82_07645 [Lactobacillus sp. LL6]
MTSTKPNIIKWLWIDSISILIWTLSCISLDGLQKLNSEIGIYLIILTVVSFILVALGMSNLKLRNKLAKYMTNWATLVYFAYVIYISFDYGQKFDIKNIIVTIIFLIVEIGLVIFNFKRK